MLGYYIPLDDLKFISPQDGFSVKYFINLFKQFQDVIPPTTVNDSPKRLSLMKGKRVSSENIKRNYAPFMPCSKKVNIAKAEELGDDFKPLRKKNNVKKNKKSKKNGEEDDSEDDNQQLPLLCPYFINTHDNDELENSNESADSFDNNHYNKFNYEGQITEVPSMVSSKSGVREDNKMRDLSPINVQSRIAKRKEQHQQQQQLQSINNGSNLQNYQPQFVQQQQQKQEEEEEEEQQQDKFMQQQQQYSSPKPPQPQYMQQYQPIQQEFTPPISQKYLPRLEQQESSPQFPPPPAPQIQLRANNNTNIQSNFPPKVMINNKVSPIYNHEEYSISPKSSCFTNQYEMIDASDLPLKHQRIGNLIVSEKQNGSSPLLNYYSSINQDNNIKYNAGNKNSVYSGYNNENMNEEDEDIIDEEVREILSHKSKPITVINSKPKVRPSPYAIPVLKKGEAQLLMQAYSLPYGMMQKKSATKLIIKHVSPDKMQKGYK